MSSIPEKAFFKVNEVCHYTDTQPYVLRFWESEFPQLAPRKSRTGQKVYTRRDVDLILRIKELLHEEEYTIADARRRLEEEGEEGRGGRASHRGPKGGKKAAASERAVAEPAAPRPPPPPRIERVEAALAEVRGAGESVADFLPDPAGRRRTSSEEELVGRAEELRQALTRAEAERRERAQRIALRLEQALESLLRPLDLPRG